MIIALNNKSNLGKDEYKNYLNELKNLETNHELILCPSLINISSTDIDNILLGAQNVSSTGIGAYTGEVSAEQLHSYGVKYAIVGHSERRSQQNESLEEIYNKINQCFENDIIPILCIGETKEEKEAHRVEEVLEKEILSAIENISLEEQHNLIVAYEPIWSIGTGDIPTGEEVEDILKFIKKYLPNTKLLYGGSVTDENVGIFSGIKEVDGFLLGGLSLKPDKLQKMIEQL